MIHKVAPMVKKVTENGFVHPGRWPSVCRCFQVLRLYRYMTKPIIKQTRPTRAVMIRIARIIKNTAAVIAIPAKAISKPPLHGDSSCPAGRIACSRKEPPPKFHSIHRE